MRRKRPARYHVVSVFRQQAGSLCFQRGKHFWLARGQYRFWHLPHGEPNFYHMVKTKIGTYRVVINQQCLPAMSKSLPTSWQKLRTTWYRTGLFYPHGSSLSVILGSRPEASGHRQIFRFLKRQQPAGSQIPAHDSGRPLAWQAAGNLRRHTG